MAPASANRETGLITPKFRLPTESEWEYALWDLKKLESLTYIRQEKISLARTIYKDRSKKKSGDQLANFKNSDGDYGGIAGWSDDRS